MFEQVFESFRKATESTIRMQQEMMTQWAGLWPGYSTPSSSPGPAAADRAFKFQKKWGEIISELVKKQQESLQAGFTAVMRNIEEAFRLPQVKDGEELRGKTKELWQKTIDCLRQSSEAQVHNFQTAVAQCTGLMTKEAVACWAAS
jgi:hypothetical protein